MKKQFIEVFESNIEATAVNRGFYYQHLITLKKWFENYINDSDEEIFTEVEDDIKQVGERVIYTQVKCYTKEFSFQSPEVIKSLFNFYLLFLKYDSSIETEFCFTTNSSIAKREKLLQNWLKCNGLTDNELADAIRKKVKSLLSKEVKKRKSKKLQKLNLSETESQRLKEAVNEFSNSLNDINSLDSFIKRIKWQFLDFDPKSAIESLNSEIDLLLQHKAFNNRPEHLIKAIGLCEVYNCSQRADKKDRLLSTDKLKKLLSRTDNELQVDLNQEFLKSIGFIESLIDQKIQGKFEGINSRLRILEENPPKPLPSLLTLLPVDYNKPFYGEESLFENFEAKVEELGKINLVGKSGTGKSSFTNKFIKRGLEKFDHIIWIGLQADFASSFLLNGVLLKNLGISPQNHLTKEENFQVVINELDKVEGKNLIVIDDCKPVKKELQEVLRLSNWLTVLISQESLYGVKSFQLPKLNFEDAKSLFEQVVPKAATDEEYTNFFDFVEYNPAIIELCSNLIKSSVEFSLAQLLSSFREGLSSEELNLEIEVDDQDEPIQFLSYLNKRMIPDSLDDSSELYLEFLALLPPEDTQITDLASIGGEKFYKKNLVDITNKINNLQRQGLIDRDGSDIKMSELLQNLIVHKVKSDTSPFMGSMLWINWLFHRIDEVFQIDPFKSFRFLKYAESILEKIDEPHRHSLYQPLLLLENALLNAYMWQGKSESLHARWIDLERRASNYLPENDHNLGIIKNNTALSYSSVGDEETATEKYMEAIRVLKKSVRYDTRDQVLNTYANLIASLINQEQFEDIEKILVGSKKLVIEVSKKDNPIFSAYFYHTQGFYYHHVGKLDAALQCFEKSIEIHNGINHHLRNNLYLIICYLSAIQVYINHGKNEKVVECLLKISDIRNGLNSWVQESFDIFNIIDFLNIFYSVNKPE